MSSNSCGDWTQKNSHSLADTPSPPRKLKVPERVKVPAVPKCWVGAGPSPQLLRAFEWLAGRSKTRPTPELRGKLRDRTNLDAAIKHLGAFRLKLKLAALQRSWCGWRAFEHGGVADDVYYFPVDDMHGSAPERVKLQRVPLAVGLLELSREVPSRFRMPAPMRHEFDGPFTASCEPRERAVREIAKHDYGVLSAPPGAGKTVMGCALIARHRTATLVLVHRAILLEQWREEAGRFLGLNRDEIGVWRGKGSRMTGRLDIAMLPSLSRVENVTELFTGYGLVIVDECHHVPAVSFEALLKACPCRRLVGLTATPERKDGLERLLHLQCGPIRHTVEIAAGETVPRTVFVRRSSFHLPTDGATKSAIHEIWQALVDDPGRTQQVANDVWAAVKEGRCPLVLPDRKTPLDKLQEAFAQLRGVEDVAVFRLESDSGIKQNRIVRAEIDALSAKRQRYVLFSTASLIGEGFDLPSLDTLFLGMPLSFKGRLIQYAGRLYRTHADKRDVVIYDYLDDNHPVTQAMFRRRAVAYRQMGYRFEIDKSLGRASLRQQLGLFDQPDNSDTSPAE